MKRVYLIAAAIIASAFASNAQTYYQNNKNPEILHHSERGEAFRKEIFLPQVNGYNVYKADLHTHTIHSDGDATVAFRVNEAWYDGLDILAVTDHIEYRSRERILVNYLKNYLSEEHKKAVNWNINDRKPMTDDGILVDLNFSCKEANRYAEKYGLLIATEMRDATHADKVVEYADMVQVGAKAMYDHGLLTAAGQSGKPVILKRGFGSTLQELVNCADFIMSCGNDQVILCERGIRSFETNTRFTLDLCGVAWLKEHCNLPIILDPSHAMGYAYGIGDLARACTAMGVDGLLIETHPCPECAQSDAPQQLNHQQFTEMYASLKPIAAAIGKTLV